ncbi:TPA: hypothetical protein HA338_04495 [Methanosarcina acetivorans]|uniref:Uncharacterized protein n=1 Tax=Methanosarcina acetivorans TaxID=2214 RepID=A0A832W7P7_9EURY|nr:hypothetical protein [Methanosarcina acetivorans]HIH93318.1 hypothetical protein [Methanosarcina acetivorans]
MPGVVGVISPASIVKQINYELTGRSKVPDSDNEVREIMEKHGEDFSALIASSFPMLSSFGLVRLSTSSWQCS